MANQIRFALTTASDSPNNHQRQDNEPSKGFACDPCRRRKIKCGKNHPCSQCLSSFHDCTYSEPVRKKRKTVSEAKIEFLEGRLKAIEGSSRSAIGPEAATDLCTPGDSSVGLRTPKQSTDEAAAVNTRGMPLAAKPCARIYQFAEKGDLEFQGYSADRTFIQGFKHELGDWAFDSPHKRVPTSITVSGLFDTSRRPVDIILPPRDIANKLVEAALDAQILFSIIHRPSFNNLVTLIYSLDKSNYGTQEWRFLALFYAVLAYGSLFVDLGEDEHDVLSQGAHYYEKSIRLQDFADCRDLVSLQAIIFKILFVLATTRVFTCYTYISAALSVALRMGLHRSFTNHQDLISREIGKRVFWALWILGNDIASGCGLPKLLSHEDIDQDVPIEVNDIYIEQGKIMQQPEGEFRPVAVANVYRKLHIIFQGVTKHIYSEKRFSTFQQDSVVSYSISMDTFKRIEEDLRQWGRETPDYCAMAKDVESPQLLTVQFSLCISYAHAQLYLYRPFLRHFMMSAGDSNPPDKLNPSWLATICIQACENIIMLCDDMYRQGLLGGGNWLVSRALFSSTLTLFYVMLTSNDTHQTRAISRCLALGRKVGDRLSKRSVPGQRWKVMITIMIATLPSSSRHVQERLLELENKIPDLTLYRAEQRNPDYSYSASLWKQALNLLGSDSSAADQLKWLAPHLLEAIGHERPQQVAHVAILEASDLEGCDLSDGGVNNTYSNDMPLESAGIDFGNIDEFLDLQNWL
ncbi:hypothetical protein FE257_010123 [Aspergillus nanangensis]|uniref:Zn(2)-C6 fungal-type domain-containing protein n=1 Tax=Aspergillus nanangensis TaxID=2582783 RepID=A0AAD4GSF5_ASPNN|nr:hypothetical protein FE257_010123 [Aspergillus nanangensis]